MTAKIVDSYVRQSAAANEGIALVKTLWMEPRPKWKYRKISNIRRTKFQNSNVSRLDLQLP